MTEISQTTPQEQTQNNTPTQKYLPIEKKSGFFLQIGLISLLLSLVFYTFFLWEDLGISFPIFTTLIIGYILYTAKIAGKNISGFQILLSLMVICVSLGVGLLENDTITTINFFSTLLGLGYLFQSFHNKSHWQILLSQTILNSLKTISFSYSQYKYVKNNSDAKVLQGYEKNIQAIVISFLLVIIFGGLLYSGDLVFAYFIDNTLGKISFPSLGIHTIFEGILIWIVFLLISGIAFSFYSDVFELKAQKEPNKDFDVGQAKMIITSIVCLFVCYLLLQASYLTLGDNIISHLDFTYAEYAKKGYYELGIISCICLILIQIFYKRVSNGDKSLIILLLTLSGIILIFIILSAQRLNLYENAYGLTLLRWHGYMILVGLFLLFLTQIVLISTNQNFQNNYRNILLIVLLLQSSSNMVNPENFIAMYNFERQLQQDLSLNRKFDSVYVQSLGLDSLKAKIHIYKHTPDPVLKKEYHEDLLYLYGISIRVKQKWFTYSRSQIEAKILLKNFQ